MNARPQSRSSMAYRERRSGALRHISADHFFILLVLTMAAFPALFSIIAILNLKTIEKITATLERERLPAILESRRTAYNIEALRNQVSIVFLTDDPQSRRTARLHAQTYAGAAHFETSPEIVRLAPMMEDSILKLEAARKRSYRANDVLHRGELRLATALSHLKREPGSGLNIPLPGHSFRHHTIGPETENPLTRGAEYLESIWALCRRQTLSEAALKDCRIFQQEYLDVATAWSEKGKADQEAATLWQHLDSQLQRMRNASSSEELKRTQQSMEGLRAEVHAMSLGLYFSGFLLCCAVGFGTLTVRRHVLSPISTAAAELERIRDGGPSMPPRPVRIRELQQLLDLLPGLGGYLHELAARSGALEEEKNKFESLSLVDALTGVGNRRAFDLRMEALAEGCTATVLMLDVDFFKRYNDALGHQSGDACLQAVAKAARATLRRIGDDIFRYGGEEFAALLPNASQYQALVVAESIMEHIRALHLPHPDSPLGALVTVSIGLAVPAGSGSYSARTMVAAADKALYDAKRQGRNRICLSQETTGAKPAHS